MKRVLLVGNVACGKTTLCQRLNGLDIPGVDGTGKRVVNAAVYFQIGGGQRVRRFQKQQGKSLADRQLFQQEPPAASVGTAQHHGCGIHRLLGAGQGLHKPLHPFQNLLGMVECVRRSQDQTGPRPRPGRALQKKIHRRRVQTAAIGAGDKQT